MILSFTRSLPSSLLKRQAADENVEFLALYDLGGLALAHGAVKMREQVGYDKLRLAVSVAD